MPQSSTDKILSMDWLILKEECELVEEWEARWVRCLSANHSTVSSNRGPTTEFWTNVLTHRNIMQKRVGQTISNMVQWGWESDVGGNRRRLRESTLSGITFAQTLFHRNCHCSAPYRKSTGDTLRWMPTVAHGPILAPLVHQWPHNRCCLGQSRHLTFENKRQKSANMRSVLLFEPNRAGGWEDGYQS
jgi:hypothetical protein